MHLMTRRSSFSSTSLFLTLVTWTSIDFYFSHSHVLVVDCIIFWFSTCFHRKETQPSILPLKMVTYGLWKFYYRKELT